ncbi:MAG: sterol desaturase family protein [Rhodocyclaceae bacterium]|nr:MAG: sterol desaturase family protein [Rhodocyclaceae bacterium]
MEISQLVAKYEIAVRLGCFFGIFGLMAIWEWVAPKRQLSASKAIRWANNLGIVVLNSFILRLVFPAAGVGMAVFAEAGRWGLLHHYLLPFWAAVVVSVVLLDFFIYLQHVMVHAVPILWRLHQVHHADLDFDVTTGARFHPIEIMLSMLIKFSIILLLGPPVLAVVIFEVLLNATSMFNHGNVQLPLGFDRVLRWLLVTPDMHRVHHSMEDDETNSNFGFSLPWWDRLFGTYRNQPRAGHEHMTIGIRTYRDKKWCSWLPGMLAMPFRGPAEDYSINRSKWESTDAVR